MKTKDRLIIICLGFIFLAILFLLKKEIFFYKFDRSLIERYFLSQDIPHEVKGKRLFLSDSDIHMAAGYLYANGEDPSQFNFEKPPPIKYLYGISIIIFKNPYYIQILFGLLLILLTYYAGRLIYKNSFIPTLACLLLIADPVFIDMVSSTMLDLSQVVFFLLYFLMVFFLKENFIIQGIALALFAGSKFWITPVFFVGLFSLYNIYKKKFNVKIFLLHLLIAQVVYAGFYLKTFINNHGLFNIFFFQLKVLKYYINHNTGSFPGAALIMFLSGFTKTWWDNHEVVRSNIWTPVWPAGFTVLLIDLFRSARNYKPDIKLLITSTPVIYVIFISFQVPFPRYFLIVLPFLYLSTAHIIFKFIERKHQ